MPPNSPQHSLILASGGVESATLLAMAAHDGDTLLPVFLNYGQRPAAMEQAAARAQCRRLSAELEVLEMADVAAVFHAGQERLFHIPLPHRNLVALSLALSLAEKRGAHRVVIGTTRDDAGASPTATPAFLDQFRTMAQELGEVTVEAPLEGMDKATVVETGTAHGVDFATTYSCLLGGASPCGRCPQCRKRAEAFAGAGRVEPACTLPPAED